MVSVSSTYRAIVAIDFGTSGTGYAYAFATPGQELNPVTIFKNAPWPNTSTTKTSTSILLKRNAKGKLETVEFGHTAVNTIQGMEEAERKTYIFLHNFKMELYKKDKPKSQAIMITDDVAGVSIPAAEAVSACLTYVKECALKKIKDAGVTVTESEVLWVVTIPAIWPADSKDLMMKASKQSGLKQESRPDMFRLVYEPEAASMWFLSDPMYDVKTGDTYILADLGGGTVDVSVHKVVAPLTVKEVSPCTGGPWGSTQIDCEFYENFEELVGKSAFDAFKKDSDWVEFQGSFEKQKMAFAGNNVITLRIPEELRKAVVRGCADFNKKYQTNYQVKGKQLILTTSDSMKLFDPTIQKTVEHIETLVKQNPNITKIGDSILLGAVLAGHKPEQIQEKLSAYSFGFASSPKFDPKQHLPKYKIIIGGEERATPVAHWLVQYGDRVRGGGHTVDVKGFPVTKNQKQIRYEIYEGSNPAIKYLDHKDARLLGIIETEPMEYELLSKGVTLRLKFEVGNYMTANVIDVNGNVKSARISMVATDGLVATTL
ncbi:UNVERIFIED_CONTAM: hypothetical protein HDU68_001692 [Siphonaria sp. JEL0065]|nr:hypothetical protein HDU68_001692 [Siphonaria sp. JEL0065]